MRRSQRIVSVVYCLGVAYCFVWIPWSVTSSDRYVTSHQRLGYGWIWAGPQYPEQSTEINRPQHPGTTTGTASLSDIREFTPHSEWDGTSAYARPDFPLIILRLVALTLIFAAAFLLTGFQPRRLEQH
jgi:hypothetical protein